jgi:hypothetical protein
VRRWIVCQHHYVLSLLVAKIVVDTFFFHQSRNKVEIRLPVLDAIVSRTEVAIEAEFKVVKAEIFENLLDNVGNLLVLEAPALGGPGKKPEPRNHFGVIRSEAAILACLGKAADKAMPMTLSAIRVKNT